MASEFASWVESPFGIIALILWTLLTGAGLLLLAPGFGRRTPSVQTNTVQRVFRNSAVPIASQVLVRVVDLIVAIALLRLLGPTGNGQYALAVVVWLYVKTFSDFGLALLATREVARDPGGLATIVGETTVFRWLVLLGTALPVVAYIAISLSLDAMASASALAITLLYLSIIPSSYGESVNAAMNGLERMEIAAIINVGVSIVRAPLAVALGASVLGVPGVALAALLTSVLSAATFHRSLHSLVSYRLTLRLSRVRARWYARESWPLLVTSFLVILLFRLDVFVVQAFKGDAALGIYDASFKLINLLSVVPAYAILAVFPILTRRADDPDALARAERVTVYVLVTGAWIIVFSLTALSNPAIRFLAGGEYLPDAASLLRILIWFAPLSFMNGVLQYVLIATGEQRRLVVPLLAAVAFNLGLNLALVPSYGAWASAYLTVATEVVIFLGLVALALRYTSRIHPLGVARRLWRPTLAGIAATAIALWMRDQPLLGFILAAFVFAVIAFAVRVIGVEERLLIRRLLGCPEAVSG